MWLIMLCLITGALALQGGGRVGRNQNGGGRAAVSPASGRARGLRLARGGRGRYVAPRDTPSKVERQAQERNRDLFGEPGEWRARGKRREWNEWNDDQADRAAVDPHDDRVLSVKDFNPKVWRAEAGGGKNYSFFAGAPTFASVGASEEMQAALAACGAARPSHVQAAGFAPILAGEDVALADQTGSGKTIAYLAPIVQAVRAAEAESGRTPDGSVRVIVLTPTSELAQQVASVAKQLAAAGVPFRSTIITGEHKWRTQAKCAKTGVEMIVATPGRLRAHLEADEPSFSLRHTSHIVLDEADLLFEDDDFELTWEALRRTLPSSASTTFVTATLPNWLIERAQKQLPLLRVLRGKTLHRTVPGVRETLIDCSAGERVRGDGDAGFALKATALARELSNEPAAKVLIFCNTIESCRRVENFLIRRDKHKRMYEVMAFHGAIPAEARKRTLAAFTAPTTASEEPVDQPAESYEFDFREGGGAGGVDVPRLLVCTDRASRGMDLLDVGHVVLFDFPRDGVEYVRRVGRATRGARKPGRVTSLVLGRQLAYARALMKVNREGRAVDLEVHGSALAREEGAP